MEFTKQPQLPLLLMRPCGGLSRRSSASWEPSTYAASPSSLGEAVGLEALRTSLKLGSTSPAKGSPGRPLASGSPNTSDQNSSASSRGSPAAPSPSCPSNSHHSAGNLAGSLGSGTKISRCSAISDATIKALAVEKRFFGSLSSMPLSNNCTSESRRANAGSFSITKCSEMTSRIAFRPRECRSHPSALGFILMTSSLTGL
mmetsp:Transcript_39968/g.115587  ORF Transcript_39968/g.115587 Transcript_39968/m.115587 type:complete len:201 (+) Transcript_39968:131-733(+)